MISRPGTDFFRVPVIGGLSAPADGSGVAAKDAGEGSSVQEQALQCDLTDRPWPRLSPVVPLLDSDVQTAHLLDQSVGIPGRRPPKRGHQRIEVRQQDALHGVEFEQSQGDARTTTERLDK